MNEFRKLSSSTPTAGDSMKNTTKSEHTMVDKLSECQWRFKQSGSSTWLDAKVPGCNHTDLLNHGLISDPFYADEEARLQWIEHKDWEYQCTFELSDKDLQCTEWELLCDGLDTYCDVYLNNKPLFSSENMFVSHRVRCKDYLVKGENTLRIVFYSPINKTSHLPEKNGFIYPAENDKSSDKLSVYTRKAPYHYGWDWGPRFVTSGIWRPIRLMPVEGISLADVYVSQTHQAERVTVTFLVSVDAFVSTELTAVVNCHNAQVPQSIKHVKVDADSRLVVELSIEIEHPVLWWPVGQGTPFLYDFSLSLLDDDHRYLTHQQKVGLRTIELVQEPDAHGESFYFNVNGRAVFAKGANYIPSDSFLPKVTKRKYEKIFKDALAANMNMLRVWGGGVYEDDYFYELADKYGILIWQDFMFACTLYPANEAFLENVKSEAECNIKRLRSHPCIALWCGNNEIEMGIDCWEWPEKFAYSDSQYAELKQDYHTLFHQLLPNTVKALQPDIAYIASSPISFWERPEEDAVGDNHYWGVWHGELPFSEFKTRVPRFMSEYGFQAFPLLSSIRRFCPENDYDLNSITMLSHQKHPRGNNIIKKHIDAEFNLPKDFESFLFLSQLLQAQALGTAFLAHRAARPFCMGTLYWQFNDCWPVTSWSSIDYYGKYKASHYAAKRLFQNTLVAADVNDNEVCVYAINDTPRACIFNIAIKLMSIAGEILLCSEHTYIAGDNTSNKVLSMGVNDLLDGRRAENVFLAVEWQGENDREIHTSYFTENKSLSLSKPRIHPDIDVDGDVIYVTLTANSLARYVHVEFPICDENFSDNFFDLVPNIPKTVSLVDATLASQGVELIAESLRIVSLYDTYNTD